MSRTAATYSMTWTRGATIEDEFAYTDANGVAINLTGYEARMQVRTLAGQYGTTTTTTLLLELTTANGLLVWDTAATGRLLIVVPPAGHANLNPDNAKKVRYAYSLELYVPAGVDPEYVIPLVCGKINVLGETTR